MKKMMLCLSVAALPLSALAADDVVMTNVTVSEFLNAMSRNYSLSYVVSPDLAQDDSVFTVFVGWRDNEYEDVRKNIYSVLSIAGYDLCPGSDVMRVVPAHDYVSDLVEVSDSDLGGIPVLTAQFDGPAVEYRRFPRLCF